MQRIKHHLFFFFLCASTLLSAQEVFEMNDIFSLQYANDIQISPDGEHIVYRRMGYDIMGDKSTGSLWIMKSDGSHHQKLTSRDQNESSPRWSPNGKQLAFVSTGKNGSEIFIYWMDSGNFARMSQLAQSPSSLTWSPNGTQLAFSMFVPSS